MEGVACGRRSSHATLTAEVPGAARWLRRNCGWIHGCGDVGRGCRAGLLGGVVAWGERDYATLVRSIGERKVNYADCFSL